jgi:hypothetical protein
MLRTWPLVPPQSMAQPQDTSSLPQRGEVTPMTVSIPLYAIVGVLVYIAWRYMGLRIWQLIACVVLGILLAATSAGPEISDVLNNLARWLSKP